MSHFTNIKTTFQNLSYLEKTLTKLKIPNFKKDPLLETSSLVWAQDKNKSLTFNWNGEAFDLKVDFDSWNQKYSVNHFLTRISQEYTTQLLISESQKYGFKPVKMNEYQDGSRTISLQRWNQNCLI